MTVTRIANFKAQEGKGDALKTALDAVLPVMKKAPGFISYELLQGVDDNDALVVVEKWNSIEDHKNAASLIPREDFQKVMPLMDGAPAGDYYGG